MKRLLLTTIILLGAFTSCEKTPQEPQATILIVSTDALEFASEGGEQEFIVASDGRWEITGGDGVVTYTPASGKGEIKVTVTMKANETEGNITKILKVKSGLLEKTVTFTQYEKSDIHIGTDGTLAEIFEANQSLKTATKLVIEGEMSDADFATLKTATSGTLKHLNISNLNITALPDNAFREYAVLERIDLPTKLKSIGNDALRDCVELTSITIPDGVKSIGAGAFNNCGELKSVIFGVNSKLTTIENEMFQNCAKLTSINIPEGVTSIGDHAFWVCTKLTGITIPEGVTTIGIQAFSGCEALTEITIPEEVTTFSGYAFSGCTKLTSVTFGANSKLPTIGQSAFSGCSALTSITIPAEVTEIRWDAFKNCTVLNSVTCLATTPPALGSNAFKDTPATKTLKVPSGNVTAYKESVTWKLYFAEDKISGI